MAVKPTELQEARAGAPSFHGIPTLALGHVVQFVLLNPDDGAGWAVLFTGPTLDADLYHDPALGVAFFNGIAGAARYTRPTQDTLIGHEIWHGFFLSTM
jgi:hypothetical protein